MFEFTPFSPVFLSIGPIKFHYYGLMYVIGILVGYIMMPYIYRDRKFKVSQKAHENIAFYSILCGLLGARIFYVFFYNLQYYLEYPLKVFAVWEGGMASHGGFVGGFFGAYFSCKYYKISFAKIADCFVIPLALAFMFGRFGNFINGELYGRITDVKWCMKFDGVEGCRHPSQLYSALKDFSLFLLLFSLRKTQWKPGALAILFISIYSILRFIVEFFRSPDPQIGLLFLNLSQGQWISIFLLVICMYLFVVLKLTNKVK